MVVRLKDLTAKDAEKMTSLPYSAARARAEYPESLLKSILRPLRVLPLRSLRFFAFTFRNFKECAVALVVPLTDLSSELHLRLEAHKKIKILSPFGVLLVTTLSLRT